MFREAGAGEIALFPGAVGLLGVEEVLNSPPDFRAVFLSARQQGHERPGRLRRGAGPLTAKLRTGVGLARFSPSAVMVLLFFEPGQRRLNPGGFRVFADLYQPHEHPPGAVDIIHAPPPPPGAVGFLQTSQELDSRDGLWV